MEFFIISTFINFIACMFCCVFVLVYNHQSKTVQSFAIFNLLVALWSAFYFLILISNTHNEALIMARATNIIALFIPASFLHFCLRLTNETGQFYSKILSASLIINLMILPFSMSELYISKTEQKFFFSYWPVAGPLFIACLLQFMLLIPTSLFLLWKKSRDNVIHIRSQFNILLIIFILGFLGGGTNFFLCYNIPVLPYGTPFVCLFIFGIFFLIAKYQLLNIRIALSRGFVYTIIIFLITAVYLLTTYFIEHHLKDLFGYRSLLLSIICSSVTALAFIPLKDKLQDITDKLFLGRTVQDLETENANLKKEMTRIEHLKCAVILASGIAHEIKNPLTPLRTFSELLPGRINDKEFLLKFSRILQTEVSRIDKLVHELLAFSKPSTAVLELANIHQLINSTLDFLNHDLVKNKIGVIKDYHQQTDLLLPLDPRQIQQALLNIFLNAIDAMPEGGTLSVKTIKSQENIQIIVTDSGIGIAPEDLPRILEPFFTKKDKGSGLGLCVTNEIIKNHRGKIFVESRPGQGTSFIIQMPYNSPLL